MRSPRIRYPTSPWRGPVQAVDTFGIVPNGGGRVQVGRVAPVVAEELSRQEAVADRPGRSLRAPPRVQHLGGRARQLHPRYEPAGSAFE